MIAKLHSRPILAIGFGLLGITAALVMVGWQSRGGEASPLTLDGVSAEDLADNGVTISAPPDSYRAGVDRDAATAIVAVNYPNVAVKEVLLAHIKFEDGKTDGQAWVVNLDPEDSDLVLPKASGTPTFAVAFVDADNGQFLYAMGEMTPPPGGWDSSVPPVESGVPQDSVSD